MPTLILTDLATQPSGLAAQVSGSDPAAVNEVYGVRVDAPGGDGWRLAGTRTGDGPLTLELEPALWWVYLHTTPPGGPTTATRPSLVGVTDGQASVPTRCRQAVADRIGLLDLPAVGTGNGRLPELKRVHLQLDLDTTNVQVPAILIPVVGTEEAKRPDTNATDLVGYPVKVLILAPGTGKDHEKAAGVEQWRYWIDRAFDGQRLPGVPECSHCETELDVIVETGDASTGAFNITSALIVWVWCRVPFGLRV